MPMCASRHAGRPSSDCPRNVIVPLDRRHEARHGVEERRLARAVRADDTDDPVGSNGQRNTVESNDAFEAHIDPGDLENYRRDA